MIQGFGEARQDFGKFVQYSGMMDCARTMVRTEGFLSVYKGLGPNIVKGALSTGLQFGFFEFYLKIMNDFYNVNFWI